jgi:hypothetical protein
VGPIGESEGPSVGKDDERNVESRCDRTTSERRGFSPKIISVDSRRSENTQAQYRKHITPSL